MTRYFFDFKSDGSSSIDEEGEELMDVSAAHCVALDTLAKSIPDIAIEGGSQQFAIDVRDDIGAGVSRQRNFGVQALPKTVGTVTSAAASPEN
jgi:hypothetical protein